MQLLFIKKKKNYCDHTLFLPNANFIWIFDLFQGFDA